MGGSKTTTTVGQAQGKINPAFIDLANTIGQQLLPGVGGAGRLLPQLLDPTFGSEFISSRTPSDSGLRQASVRAFEETALPTIQNQAALAGVGNSPVVSQVAGGSLAQALPGIIGAENQAKQFEEQLAFGLFSALSQLAQNLTLQPLGALGPPSTGQDQTNKQNTSGFGVVK